MASAGAVSDDPDMTFRARVPIPLSPHQKTACTGWESDLALPRIDQSIMAETTQLDNGLTLLSSGHRGNALHCAAQWP